MTDPSPSTPLTPCTINIGVPSASARTAAPRSGSRDTATTNNVFKITPGGTITEIIDATGDGAGNTLSIPFGIAVDGSGNVFVAGAVSDNVFKITPGGTITEIIDATGDGAGNTLDNSTLIAVDGSENLFVTGGDSDNAFKITPGGMITQIIDATGDGAGNTLDRPIGIAVDGSGNVFVTGRFTDNAFKITFAVEQFIRGDSDGDGIFSALVDGLHLLTFGFLGGPPPPAPYPSCGSDPELATSLGCDVSTCP